MPDDLQLGSDQRNPAGSCREIIWAENQTCWSRYCSPGSNSPFLCWRRRHFAVKLHDFPASGFSLKWCSYEIKQTRLTAEGRPILTLRLSLCDGAGFPPFFIIHWSSGPPVGPPHLLSIRLPSDVKRNAEMQTHLLFLPFIAPSKDNDLLWGDWWNHEDGNKSGTRCGRKCWGGCGQKGHFKRKINLCIIRCSSA